MEGRIKFDDSAYGCQRPAIEEGGSFDGGYFGWNGDLQQAWKVIIEGDWPGRPSQLTSQPTPHWLAEIGVALAGQPDQTSWLSNAGSRTMGAGHRFGSRVRTARSGRKLLGFQRRDRPLVFQLALVAVELFLIALA